MDHEKFDYHNDGLLRRHAANDRNGAGFVIASEMECESVIRENRALRENQTGKEEFRLAARIPVPLVEGMMRDGSFHDDDAWKKLLNNPDFREFRVWGGRI